MAKGPYFVQTAGGSPKGEPNLCAECRIGVMEVNLTKEGGATYRCTNPTCPSRKRQQ